MKKTLSVSEQSTKHFLIMVDGEETGEVVVNTPSEEEARKTYEHFNGNLGNRLTFKLPIKDVVVPSMFSSCIMSAKDFM